MIVFAAVQGGEVSKVFNLFLGSEGLYFECHACFVLYFEKLDSFEVSSLIGKFVFKMALPLQ